MWGRGAGPLAPALTVRVPERAPPGAKERGHRVSVRGGPKALSHHYTQEDTHRKQAWGRTHRFSKTRTEQTKITRT